MNKLTKTAILSALLTVAPLNAASKERDLPEPLKNVIEEIKRSAQKCRATIQGKLTVREGEAFQLGRDPIDQKIETYDLNFGLKNSDDFNCFYKDFTQNNVEPATGYAFTVDAIPDYQSSLFFRPWIHINVLPLPKANQEEMQAAFQDFEATVTEGISDKTEGKLGDSPASVAGIQYQDFERTWTVPSAQLPRETQATYGPIFCETIAMQSRGHTNGELRVHCFDTGYTPATKMTQMERVEARRSQGEVYFLELD